MSHKKFVKDIGIIGISQVITSLAGFLLLPIITKTLGPYDYGIWAQISITVSLLVPLGIMGLQMSAVRFLSAETDPKKIQESFYSILFFSFIFCLFISIIVFLASDSIAFLIFQNENASYYLKAGSGLIVLTAIAQIARFYFRIFRQIKLFGAFVIYDCIGKLVLTSIFLFQGFGLMSVIGANLIILFTSCLFPLILIIRQIGFAIPKFLYLREFLQFGLPTIPISIINWIIDSSDRYFIGYLLGATLVGIYNAAYAIGSLVHVFIMPIQMILYPELARLYDEGDHYTVRLYLSMTIKYYVMIAIPSIIGLFAISKPLLLLFTTKEFLIGSDIIPIVALGAFFAGLFQITINIFLLVKKTKFIFYIQFLSAIINIILNIILISNFGIIGAAYATLISFFIMSTFSYTLGMKYFQIHIDYTALIKCAISAMIMVIPLFAMTINSVSIFIGAILLAIIIYFVVLIVIKFFSTSEIEIFKSLIFDK